MALRRILCTLFSTLLFTSTTFLFSPVVDAASMAGELVLASTTYGDVGDPFLEDCKLMPFLRTLANRQILYIRNTGTAGDALIEEGTFSVFRKLGLSFDVCCDHINKNTELDVVMYAGGGNLVPQFQHAKKALQQWIPRSRALVLLPHTVEGHEEFLQSLPNHVYIFCRDLSSMNYVKTMHPFPQNVQFGRDMSFFFPYSTWISGNTKPAVSGLAANKQAAYLFSFRCAEAELRVNDLCERSCQIGINRDLLEEHHIGPKFGLERARHVSNWLLRELDQADFVITDRLHLAVGAFMLGKTVFTQHSSIHKVDEIISHSLMRYPEADRRIFLMGNTSFNDLSKRFQKAFNPAREANSLPHTLGREPARPSKCPNVQEQLAAQGAAATPDLPAGKLARMKRKRERMEAAAATGGGVDGGEDLSGGDENAQMMIKKQRMRKKRMEAASLAEGSQQQQQQGGEDGGGADHPTEEELSPISTEREAARGSRRQINRMNGQHQARPGPPPIEQIEEGPAVAAAAGPPLRQKLRKRTIVPEEEDNSSSDGEQQAAAEDEPEPPRKKLGKTRKIVPVEDADSESSPPLPQSSAARSSGGKRTRNRSRAPAEVEPPRSRPRTRGAKVEAEE